MSGRKVGEKKMNYKEPLASVGALVLAVTGIATKTKSLAQAKKQGRSKSNDKAGYGGSVYGD